MGKLLTGFIAFPLLIVPLLLCVLTVHILTWKSPETLQYETYIASTERVLLAQSQERVAVEQIHAQRDVDIYRLWADVQEQTSPMFHLGFALRFGLWFSAAFFLFALGVYLYQRGFYAN